MMDSKDKPPLAVVYCRNTDSGFRTCDDGAPIRVVGNISPDFPDEELWLKHCMMHKHKQGSCKHQTALGRLPTVPIYFLRDISEKEPE